LWDDKCEKKRTFASASSTFDAKVRFFIDIRKNIMAKVYEFLATGFEELEALAPVDILRRGGQEVITVSVTGSLFVESSHGVTVKADLLFEDTDLGDADLLLLPGGMPGSKNLNVHEGVRAALTSHAAKKRLIGAICAAPMVLGSLGLLQGRRATCSPGFEIYLTGAEYTAELVTEDGNIITGEGPAASMPYAYALLARFIDEQAVTTLKGKMQFLHLMEG
jgi:4-methyl-5(b-hydroxyethyl)-thiazole monophosphate biosynthesis